MARRISSKAFRKSPDREAIWRRYITYNKQCFGGKLFTYLSRSVFHRLHADGLAIGDAVFDYVGNLAVVVRLETQAVGTLNMIKI
jgi:hypothetical protein